MITYDFIGAQLSPRQKENILRRKHYEQLSNHEASSLINTINEASYEAEQIQKKEIEDPYKFKLDRKNSYLKPFVCLANDEDFIDHTRR